MVEESHAGEGHDHIVLVTLFDDQVIADGAARLGDVADTGSLGALDVVGEGEEGIGTQSHTSDAVQVSPLVFLSQALGLLGEIILPDAVGADIFLVAVDVAVDDVVPVGTAQIGAEGQS